MASKPVYLCIHTYRVNWVATRIWDCCTNCSWRKNFTPVWFLQLESHFNTAVQKECWRECEKQPYKLYLPVHIKSNWLSAGYMVIYLFSRILKWQFSASFMYFITSFYCPLSRLCHNLYGCYISHLLSFLI